MARASQSPGPTQHRGTKEYSLFEPFWEYVLSSSEERPKPERSDSFLDHLFPNATNDAPKEKILAGNDKNDHPHQPPEKQHSATQLQVLETKSSDRKGFWRRKHVNTTSSTNSSSWLPDERNDESSLRGERSTNKNLFTMPTPKSADPLGLVAAKNSFDSFLDEYYNSDVESSDEERAPSRTHAKSAKKTKENGTKRESGTKEKSKSDSQPKYKDNGISLSSYRTRDGKNTKTKKKRLLFGKKSKNESSYSVKPATSVASAGLTASSIDMTNSRSLPIYSKSSSMGRSQRSDHLQREAAQTNLTPLARMFETFDALGDVSTSDDEDEYDSTSTSTEEDSSVESSYISSTSYSYVTEVTNEDITNAGRISNHGRNKSSSRTMVSQPLVSSHQSGKHRASSTTGTEVNEVRLTYTPPEKQLEIEPASWKNLLPPLYNHNDGDESSNPTTLAGISVLSRSNEDAGTQSEETGTSGTSSEQVDSETVSYVTTPHAEASFRSNKLTASSYSLPDILPKSKLSAKIASQASNDQLLAVQKDPSTLEHTHDILSDNSSTIALQSRSSRIVCRSIKSLTASQLQMSREHGVPVHELNQEDLEEIFPKVRSISEGLPLSRQRAAIIGNSKSFEKEFPAHLQAIVNENGPQALFEYEFEKGVHKVLVYEQFGPDPRNLMRVHVSDKPPVLFREGFLDEIKVIVQVEASTVSPTDCLIRQGLWAGYGSIPLPNSPGVDVVGKVYSISGQASKKYGISTGQRVMALTQYGGNARYLAVNAGQFVKVPDSVDPAEAACLAETYLTAFQAIHHGHGNINRYKKNALKGKQLLILGSVSTNMGRALSQLSSAAAINNLFAVSKERHYQRLTSIGILPLSLDPTNWFDRLKGKIDLIISFNEEVTPLYMKILRPGGEVFRITDDGSGVVKEHEQRKSTAVLSCKSLWQSEARMTEFNIYNEWENNLDRCKKDLEHLIKMLDARIFVPEVVDRIPLHKVARAHELIAMKNIPGFIVCEPWIISKSRAVLL